MAIIQAGLSANIQIPAGQVLTVRCLGSAATTLTIRSAAAAVLLDIASSAINAAYGPYSVDVSADMDATGGQVDYTVGQANVVGSPTVGQVAALIALAGPMQATLIGDSFNQQGWQTSATSNQALANGWTNHLQWLLNSRFTIAANLAVSGKRMDEVVNEQLPTAVANASTLLILTTPGTNDATAGRTSTQIISSLQTIFAAAYSAGKKVVTTTIPPRGSTSFSGNAFTAGQLAAVLPVNNWLRERASAIYPNVIVIDVARRLLDTSSIANAAAFWMVDTLTVDGLHPNSLGAITMAQEGFAVLQNVIPPIRRVPNGISTGTVGDLTNAFRNAYQIAGTGGTVGAGASGACPQYWGVGRSSGSIAGACSVEARSASFNDGGIGNVTRCDITVSAAVGDRFTYYPVPIDLVPVAGESWYFTQEIDVNMSSGTLVEILPGGTVTGGATLSFTAGANVTTASWGVSTYRGVIRSRDFTIQTGATGFAFQTDLRTSVGAVGTVRFGTSELRKVIN